MAQGWLQQHAGSFCKPCISAERTVLPVPMAGPHRKKAVWRLWVTSGQLPSLLIAESLLGGQFLFHSFWKSWGITNLWNVCLWVAQRLLHSYANERLQTPAVYGGSGRPDSCALLISHLYFTKLKAAQNNWTHLRFWWNWTTEIIGHCQMCVSSHKQAEVARVFPLHNLL